MNELFAIEPEAFADHRDVKYLLEQFGFTEGRFVAEYPSSWVRRVFDHLRTLPDYEHKKAEAAFNRYRGTLLVPTGYPYSGEISWLHNARNAKAASAIADVIASRNNDCGAPTPDIDKEYFFKWGGRNAQVLSSPQGYASAASVLLRLSHEVVFVDPFVICFASRFQAVLMEMAKLARSGGKCDRFFVYSLEDRSSAEQMTRGARAFFAPIAASGIKVTFVALRDVGHKSATPHPRFLLSIKGALQYDRGFDAEDPPRHQIVSTVDKPLHDTLCQQYLEGALPYEAVLTVNIE